MAMVQVRDLTYYDVAGINICCWALICYRDLVCTEYLTLLVVVR